MPIPGGSQLNKIEGLQVTKPEVSPSAHGAQGDEIEQRLGSSQENDDGGIERDNPCEAESPCVKGGHDAFHASSCVKSRILTAFFDVIGDPVFCFIAGSAVTAFFVAWMLEMQ